jgi:hypothetical protein
MSSTTESSLTHPEHLISPLAMEKEIHPQLIHVLDINSTMERRVTRGMAGVLASCENQRPIQKTSIVASALIGNIPAALCLDSPSSSIERSLSPFTQAANSTTPPTDDDSPNSSITTYLSFPSEDSNNMDSRRESVEHPHVGQDVSLRRASIDHLHLGPLAEEGVNIHVESDGIIRSFLVHTELLCHFSPYFRTFLGRREQKVFTKEVKTQNYKNELDFGSPAYEKAKEDGSIMLDIKVKFPTVGAQYDFRLDKAIGEFGHNVFATFIDWLYLGPGKFEPKDVTEANKLLIQLWVLAGRLGIPSCQNDCIVALEENRKRSRTVATSMLEWIYKNTRDYGKTQCGLKNLLIDQCALTLDENWFLQGMHQPGFSERFPTECLFDIIARMRVLLRESGLGEGSLVIAPASRRYLVDGGESKAA